MNETEYIVTTNLANLRSIRSIFTNILPGEDYGISKEYHTIFIRELDRGIELLSDLIVELTS